MTIQNFLSALRSRPESIAFTDTIGVIDNHYAFTPTRFTNGDVVNEAGTNSGSCKLFAFAQIQGLNEQETLHCFGTYYREDVLLHPEGTSHANIRNFMRTGWHAIHFDAPPLSLV